MIIRNNMQCVICSMEFEGRKDARFCSANCRVKGNRMDKTNKIGVTVSLPATEKIKKDNYLRPIPSCPPDNELVHCTECVTFESGIHWCGNKECGCFETKEEQVASLKEFQQACTHPTEEQFWSKCLHCGALVPMVKRQGSSFYKKSDTK